MKFRFEFDIKKPSRLINHPDKLFLIGSCFTENIGEKLKRFKFSVLENPHGILFNPVSVAEALTDCIEDRQYTHQELFPFNEGWHSWKHHSRFSAPSAEEAIQKINDSIGRAHRYLKEADILMITLGSAWTYTLTEKALNAKKGNIAANNHKAPADWFQRKLMTNEEVLSVLDNVIHRVFHLNPDVQIFFTVSPVRHIREGAIENNRSKAALIQAVHHLVDKFDKLYYFPAYELVIDDLRDYRFYSEDLVHPNYFATQYVWEKFTSSCMNEETIKLLEEIHSINLAFQHKPFNSRSGQHKQFLNSYHERTTKLLQRFPWIDFSKELKYFREGQVPNSL